MPLYYPMKLANVGPRRLWRQKQYFPGDGHEESLMNKLIRIEGVSERHKTHTQNSWHDYVIHKLKTHTSLSLVSVFIEKNTVLALDHHFITNNYLFL